MANGSITANEGQVAAGTEVAPGIVHILTVVALVPQARATMKVTATTTMTGKPHGTWFVVDPVRRGSLAETGKPGNMLTRRMFPLQFSPEKLRSDNRRPLP